MQIEMFKNDTEHEGLKGQNKFIFLHSGWQTKPFDISGHINSLRVFWSRCPFSLMVVPFGWFLSHCLSAPPPPPPQSPPYPLVACVNTLLVPYQHHRTCFYCVNISPHSLYKKKSASLHCSDHICCKMYNSLLAL